VAKEAGPHEGTGDPHEEGPSKGGLYVPPPLPRPVTLSGPRLLYRDDSGEHVHPIAKDLTKIGRGGAEHWVDVMVTAGAQVSREHCRIRRDAVGRLFLQDVSTWGTYLNGAAVAKFVDGDGGASEHELTHGASIRLADAVTIELLLR
jgi:pSer/pThr/pTyr-binding forkhead associated (FHA) protein